jgi:glucose-6-phosphate isomerase
MTQPKIQLYYKNVTSAVIGAKDGISPEQFKALAEQAEPATAKLNQQRKAGEIPYRDLPYNKEYPTEVEKIAREVRGTCENFVVLGIGGSALGNIALQTALNPYMYNLDANQRKNNPRLFVFDNVDPCQLGSFLDYIKDHLDKTIFNVVSKSGRTAETASQFMIIRKMLIDAFGADKHKDHIIATTDRNEGTLRKIADEAGYRSLPVPDGVGGRFSVLSPVGLLSAAVCGIDINELLAGGRDMDEKVSLENFFENPAAINAAINCHYYNRKKNISVMMPYAYALKDFADWYRQLWAESLGKSVDLAGREVHVGPTPVKALGATDQHSQVQLYREGPNDKLFTFLQVKDFGRKLEPALPPECANELEYLAGKDLGQLLNNEKLATEYALIHDKRPCMTVLFDKLCPRTIGAFIYLFEVTTSLAGLLLDIDAYDQPAVELGKEATFALMNKPGSEQLAERIRPIVGIDDEFLV